MSSVAQEAIARPTVPSPSSPRRKRKSRVSQIKLAELPSAETVAGRLGDDPSDHPKTESIRGELETIIRVLGVAVIAIQERMDDFEGDSPETNMHGLLWDCRERLRALEARVLTKTRVADNVITRMHTLELLLHNVIREPADMEAAEQQIGDVIRAAEGWK